MQLDIFHNRKKEMMIALIKYENSRLRRKMRKTNDKIYFFFNSMSMSNLGQARFLHHLYIGAREEARDLALALARACSLTSARSCAPARLPWTCLYLARLRAAISSASSICFL